MCERGLFQSHDSQILCQNANFENGGTTIQIGILYVLLNNVSISFPSRVHETSGYFKIQMSSHGRKLAG